MKTGVFDSGVGGLTVLKELRRLAPNGDFVYFADTARLPYGVRAPEQVLAYAEQIVRLLADRGCGQVVIACGTVSCCAHSGFLSCLPVPVITALPPTAEYAAGLTKNGVVALTATQATVDSGAFEREMRKINPEIRVISEACPEFVILAQQGEFCGEKAQRAAEARMKRLAESAADTLILGCTHFPLLREVISQCMPNAEIADISALEAACAAKSWPQMNSGGGSVQYVVSGDTGEFCALARRILGEDCTAEKHEW